ncbi:DNA polymerase III subunit delta' [Schaalia sp. Marseille-Q2122]|uniref:DNA polymerase III subunit delta' n=1 Tax=Schaalia sp. Marseille-Q2122 TaxID=2736604 RepID=UPI001588CD2D|nr:DNA polymerase III subunit delta' [Schaalia sp. Marseille-Q2122]
MSVWEQLVGQDAAIEVLAEAALAARRIVDGQRSGAEADTDDARSMTHAWLITGPPGSGRSVAALAFAAALQCTGPTPGCGECPGCRTTMGRTNGDVHSVSTEATQIRIEEARDIVGRAQVAPSQGRWRVILVEDADRMTERTSNVLLKAVEEPPARTVWLLCAPSPEDMITTIRSRCRHLALRIPSVQAVADLLVRRDGVDPAVAVEAARSAQSHIGLARALARDPQMRQRRREIITAPITVRSVGEAVMAAADLLETAKTQAEAQTEERNARERAELLRQLGMEEGERPSAHSRAQLHQLEEEQKRRAKRAIHDVLDRALVDLLAIYRDVLMLQLGTGADLVNEDIAVTIGDIARASTTVQTLERVEAIEEARRRLAANVAPALALEAMAIALRPQV